MVVCASCGEETSYEADPSNGTAYCPLCGAVAEENGIVAEVTFGETGAGAAVVTGSYVGADQLRARFGGGRRPGGGGVESREQTIAKGRREINGLVTSFSLPDRFADQALRFYTLALNTNFTRGRRVLYVVAACVYIVCRIEKRDRMLIDFSDFLKINVFVLGSTYMKLVKELNLNHTDIPVIDPAVYISRFAALLDFGEEENRVANDAVRLVQRFSRDWMNQGRRPAGICGACLIIAARMNNFRRSIEEVVQIVKIADTTVRKRLEEFAMTETSTLTIQDWRSGAWFDEGADPPAFIESVKKDQRERMKNASQARSSAKKVRFNNSDSSDEDQEQTLSDVAEEDETQEGGDGSQNEADGQAGVPQTSGSARTELNAQYDALAQGDADGLAGQEEEPAQEGVAENEGEAADEGELAEVDEEDEEAEIDDILGGIDGQVQAFTGVAKKKRGRPAGPPTQAQQLGWKGRVEPPPDTRTPDEIAQDAQEHEAIASDITTSLSAKPYVMLDSELADKERARYIAAQAPAKVLDENGTLSDLDEEDLDAYILTEEEVRIKERLWMEFNKDYLEKVAARHLAAEVDEKPLKKRNRTKRAKPRDSSTALGETAAESTKKLLKQKKFSKKINYAAIESLLGDDNAIEGIEGLDGQSSSKRNNLFDEDANEQWENGSQRSSRAGSLAPSIGSSSGGRKKRKRKASRDDTEEQAEKLRRKLQSGPKPVKRSIGPGPGNKANAAKIAATFGGGSKGKNSQANAPSPERVASPQGIEAHASPEPVDSPGESPGEDSDADDGRRRQAASPVLDAEAQELRKLMGKAYGGDDDESNHEDDDEYR